MMTTRPELMPGQRYDAQLVTTLRRLAAQASDVRTAGAPGQPAEKFMSFTASTVEQLRHALRPNTLDRLILTQRYWAITGMNPSARSTSEIVDIELVDCIARLNAAAEATHAEMYRWRDAGAVLVPDTNIFLHAMTETIERTDWRKMADIRAQTAVTVAILIAVIDELDRTKRNEDRSMARRTLNELDTLLYKPGSCTLTSVGGPITLSVIMDDAGHEPLQHADSEIAERALSLQARAAPSRVIVLTGDSGMTMRARHLGLDAVKVPTPERKA